MCITNSVTQNYAKKCPRWRSVPFLSKVKKKNKIKTVSVIMIVFFLTLKNK